MTRAQQQPQPRLGSIRFGAIGALAVALAACQFPAPATLPGIGETPSAVPVVVSGSIAGRVWSDLCDPASSPSPPGCVAIDAAGTLRANGILEGGEAGLAGVTVWIGSGACPAAGLASAETAGDGSYQFTGLGAGTYCVWVDPERGPDGRPLSPGTWSFPQAADPSGAATITTTLGTGEARTGMNFGWDLLNAPAPTAASGGAQTPTTTPASSDDPRTRLGDPAWEDSFDVEDNWPVYEDAHVRFAIGDGRLTMTSLSDENWDGWMLTWPEIGDFFLEGAFTPGPCDGLDRYGLMFRAGPSAQGYVGYLFSASCDGRTSLRAWDGSAFTDPVGWTASERVSAPEGGTIRLGVWADGETLRLYADGELLAETSDGAFSEGMFGVFIAAAETLGFQVRVDDVAYWTLP